MPIPRDMQTLFAPFFWLPFLFFGLTLGSSTAHAAPRVHIRGKSNLQVHTSGSRERIRITGMLRDEIGTPISDATLVISPRADRTMEIPWTSIGSCMLGTVSNASVAEHTVKTDATGGFCVLGVLERGEALIRVVYAGDHLHEGTGSEVFWNAHRHPLSLRFAPPPDRVDLDARRILVFVRTEAPAGVTTQGVELTLTQDGSELLASATVDGAGTAHFDFPSSLLADPGIGTMEVRYPGREDLAEAVATTSVTRFARVVLRADQRELQGDPSKGLVVRVGAQSLRGLVGGGSIEASLDSQVVGAGQLVDGWADVTLTFQPRQNESRHEVTFRYRADTPYYQSAEPITVTVMVVEPSAWLRAMPGLAAVLIAALLLRGWWRPKRRPTAVPARSFAKGITSLDVVRPLSSQGRWVGRVMDAHDESAVVEATIRVIVPTFVEVDVLLEVRTDESGAFEFELSKAARSEKGLRLQVESYHHASIDRPLPPPSELVIALVSLRRQLLDQLVGWARRAGKPWHQGLDPTPGHVLRVASGQRSEAVALWATRVEAGAYGPDPVDHHSAKEVRDMEPRGQPVR